MRLRKYLEAHDYMIMSRNRYRTVLSMTAQYESERRQNQRYYDEVEGLRKELAQLQTELEIQRLVNAELVRRVAHVKAL